MAPSADTIRKRKDEITTLLTALGVDRNAIRLPSLRTILDTLDSGAATADEAHYKKLLEHFIRINFAGTDKSNYSAIIAKAPNIGIIKEVAEQNNALVPGLNAAGAKFPRDIDAIPTAAMSDTIKAQIKRSFFYGSDNVWINTTRGHTLPQVLKAAKEDVIRELSLSDLQSIKPDQITNDKQLADIIRSSQAAAKAAGKVATSLTQSLEILTTGANPIIPAASKAAVTNAIRENVGESSDRVINQAEVDEAAATARREIVAAIPKEKLADALKVDKLDPKLKDAITARDAAEKAAEEQRKELAKAIEKVGADKKAAATAALAAAYKDPIFDEAGVRAARAKAIETIKATGATLDAAIAAPKPVHHTRSDDGHGDPRRHSPAGTDRRVGFRPTGHHHGPFGVIEGIFQGIGDALFGSGVRHATHKGDERPYIPPQTAKERSEYQRALREESARKEADPFKAIRENRENGFGR